MRIQMLHAVVKLLAVLFLCCICFDKHAGANVISVDTQNFNPTYNGLDFVTVQSSETLAPGIFNLGLFLNYAVNTLPYYSKPGSVEGKDSRLGKVRDALTSADLSFGLGLTTWWDVGISVPFVLSQQVNSNDSRGEYAESGMTEVRLATKVRFVGNRSRGIGLVLSSNFNMIEDNPFVGEGGGPIFNAELVGDITLFRRLALALNVGYRARNPGDQVAGFPIEPTKDQVIGSAAASYLFRSIDTKLIAEVFASAPLDESSSSVARDHSSAEALLGLKHDVNASFALHMGAGTELNHSYASPDWRIYAGTNVALGPMWGNKDDKLVQPKVAKRKKPSRPPPPVEPEPEMVAEQTPPEEEPEAELEPVGAGEEYASDADETFVLKDIYFAFDSDYRALAGAKEMLSRLANRIKGKNFSRMTIEGHTDSLGSYEYNINLGMRRANTVATYLVKQFGLQAGKITVQSYGETRPIGDNGNYQGRQLNRRVVFRIYY